MTIKDVEQITEKEQELRITMMRKAQQKIELKDRNGYTTKRTYNLPPKRPHGCVKESVRQFMLLSN